MPIIEIKDGSGYLTSAITPEMMALVGGMEGRRKWLNDGRLKFEPSQYNMTLFTNVPELVVKSEEIAPNNTDFSALQFEGSGYRATARREDRWYQAAAKDRARDRRFFGVFLEQGLGKTKVAIDLACERYSEGKIAGLLVISKKGPHRQWVEEHLPKDASVVYTAHWWRGKKIDFNLPSCLQVFTINWDALRTKAGFAAAMDFCNIYKGRLMIVADESQEIKNASAGRSIAAKKLAPFANYRMLLTGTPIAKDLTDEWAQLKWLDEDIVGIRYLTTFRANYCVMGGFEGRAVVGHKNIQQFKELTAPHIIRIEKKDAGFIPKTRDSWHFDLTAEQLRMINEAKKDAMVALENGQIVHMNYATGIMNKMQQIGSGFIISLDKSVHRLMEPMKNPRAIAALEWLDANEGPAIIWCRYREDIAIVREVLQKEKISHVEYYGDTSERLRKDAIESFRNERARVFLANPAAAGTGIDGLQDVCSQALYYTNSFNAIDRWQSEDRIDRIGMLDGGARYTDLEAHGSPDKHIRRNIQKKEGISNLALRGLEEFLNDG